MFELGMGEMAVIGIVALIVVGPKDLPVLFRNIGNFVGKAQGMAREFSRAMNDAAKDSGVSEINQTLRSAGQSLNTAVSAAKNPKAYGAQKLRDAAGLSPTTVEPTTVEDEAAGDKAEAEKTLRDTGAAAMHRNTLSASAAGVGKPTFAPPVAPAPVTSTPVAVTPAAEASVAPAPVVADVAAPESASISEKPQ
ncbi:Sec-independent protein translocase protein tatB-like protein, putative [Ketogulonicigenium robustum]|uniref:Sec-independent protein translocase protein tatB-like protein, putative n=1 Tax=Ketogulonicigenium robustum TaxID=92947 RepID=A0A1W6P0K6_9RHOB|nr:twin-arginine translocase TatA/TatE family subunit [Ketogulonicigenium robustum]ARO14979.1 Sec-independent protein translocase protein tatB-like protein, putative [Ketogulonicigenium robustum]